MSCPLCTVEARPAGRRLRLGGAADIDGRVDAPHATPVWHHEQGGKAGDRIAGPHPDITAVARGSRAFRTRAVTFLVAERGIRQFLDIGTGLPAAAGSRIGQVDHDPPLLARARALLTGTQEGATGCPDVDLRDPDAILDLAGRTTLDPREPVGLILMNVLGHVGDLAEAAAIVRRLMAAVPSGSYLITADGTDALGRPALARAVAVWNAHAPLAYRLRSPEQIAGYLDGLELVEPGLVPCARWRPDPAASPADLRPADEFGAVVRKP